MTELVQTIKKAAIEAVEAEVPAAPFVGTVVAEDPIAVRLSQRLTLPAARLMFLQGQGSLAVGDRLALLRFQGGQRYLVLGVLI